MRDEDKKMNINNNKNMARKSCPRKNNRSKQKKYKKKNTHTQ